MDLFLSLHHIVRSNFTVFALVKLPFHTRKSVTRHMEIRRGTTTRFRRVEFKLCCLLLMATLSVNRMAEEHKYERVQEHWSW